MSRHIKIYSSGLLISFLGTLPLGTLNITAFQIASTQSTKNAVLFAIAAILIELIVVRLTLTGVNKFKLDNKLSFYIYPIAVVLLVYLSFSSFTSVGNTQPIDGGKSFFPMIKSAFLLGLLLSVLNPMHIPFWMGWNKILFSRNTLDNQPGMFTSYMLGIGIGSLAGLMVFILAGKLIFQNFQNYSDLITIILGCLYLSFAVYLLFILYKNHLKLKPL